MSKPSGAVAVLWVQIFAVGVLFAVAAGGQFFAYRWQVPGEALAIRPLGYDALNGWAQDDPRPAAAAFLRSCHSLDKRAPDQPLGRSIRSPVLQRLYGRVQDWKAVCRQAERVLPTADAAAARRFFETAFVPVRIDPSPRRAGLFTGYFEPELKGSLTPGPDFPVPLLRPPDDLVEVDLGQFRAAWKGERIAGRLRGRTLVPYATRAEIDRGALDAAALALVWVDDAVDAFFLHIQGSGRVVLPDGAVMRVGYAASNGHSYVSIGRVLIDRGALSRDEVSMDTIRAWLAAHPDEARDILEANPSYVFFQPLAVEDPALGPLGAQGVPLTPGRSLAVDRRFHALGVPMWVETGRPPLAAETAAAQGAPAAVPVTRLMVAQDTGGAIRGVQRGDVFWGFGPAAAALAGGMKHEGHMVVLIPKQLFARFWEEAPV